MIEAIVVLSVLVGVLVFGFCIDVIVQYKKESKYVKMEMARSCSHRERAYWEKELKNLRKRYIPFLYLFDKK